MSNIDQMQQTNAKQRVNIQVRVTNRDLPLSCPLPNMTLWNMHPKVYLTADADGQAVCPYCATQYTLDDE